MEDYLALLSQTDAYYAQILEFENQKADAGLGPSDATIDRILESCESYRIDPDQNFLTETFAARLASLEQEVPLTQSRRRTSTPAICPPYKDILFRPTRP